MSPLIPITVVSRTVLDGSPSLRSEPSIESVRRSDKFWGLGFPAGQAPTETFDFEWRPRPGQIVRYRLSMNVELPGTRLAATADLTQRIGKRDRTGGFSVANSTKNLIIVTDADRETQPDEPDVIERFDARGQRLSTADDSAGWFASGLGHSTDFIAPVHPVRVGQAWTVAVAASDGLLAGTLGYRLIDVAKRGKSHLLHVHFSFRESSARLPVTADGYFFIDPNDFTVVESEALVHNVRMSPDMPPSPAVEVHMARR